jgi:hypothetical protein
MTQLEITLSPNNITRFTTLLQNGMSYNCTAGESLGVFLSTLPGFTNEYIADKIQTIFLNGAPIDDLTTPINSNHSVLALSAAMPGLAGAIFRRNSLHASLRGKNNISKSVTENTDISVTLKLFNTIAAERGPALLQAGASINSEILSDYFTKRPSLKETLLALKVNEDVLEIQKLDSFLSTQTTLRISIKEHHATTI